MGETSWLGRQVGATAGGGRGRERVEVGEEGREEDTGACQSRSCREKGQGWTRRRQVKALSLRRGVSGRLGS